MKKQMNQWIKEVINDETMQPEMAAAKSDDWNVHMQLSPLRQSILNWYEFDRNASLLELNAGYGALTGLFCRRCKKVTSVVSGEDEAEILAKRYTQENNLRIVKENTNGIDEEETADTGGLEMLKSSGERFDYVVVQGEMEYAENPASAVAAWMQLLKPEGILLMTVENRCGLKYFCGAKDPHTSLPFDGVNGYLFGTGGRGQCLSRQEVVAAIESAGVQNYKFYYPVPDSRMPQMIFSDDYKKGVNTAERLVDYDYEDPAMFGVEHRLFCDVVNNGALPFLANSFLIELTKEGSLSDIIYAVVTTDRGKERGTATTIRQSGVVKKRPLWQEGTANIRKLHEYTCELADRGIPVVETELKQDSYGLVLSMPYMDEEGLSPVMKRLAAEDREQFLHIFDEIYGYIMAASDTVQDAKDGEVLERAYLDLAPCNCFCVKETGALLFYDQEFVMENCPAKFAMFRTLKYCYASAGIMEKYIPLRTMYARYGIDEELAADFEIKEKEFIQSVRHTNQYEQMFRWATPDYGKMYERMKKSAEILVQDKEKTVRKPYRIGYVPGVFDLFHTGHLNLLERCKSRCEYLIVGVLTDELVEFYKGHGTVIPYEGRARVIEALQVVDEVVPVDFSNTDKLDAWEQLHYDCHFSGDDHVNHWNDVWEELKKRGSNMEFFPYTAGISSTQIREKL